MRAALSAYAGPMPRLRRADLELAEPPLGRRVEHDVPRHDQVRVAGQVDPLERDPAPLRVVHLLDEHRRVDHAAGAEHAVLPADDAGRHLPELERLAVDDDRVPRVRPAVVAADDVGVLGEQVDDLALALVAPLRTDDHGRGHARSVPAPPGVVLPRPQPQVRG